MAFDPDYLNSPAGPLPPGSYSFSMGGMTDAQALAFMGLHPPCPFEEMEGAGVSQQSAALDRMFDMTAQAFLDCALVGEHLTVCKDCQYALTQRQRIMARFDAFHERHRRIQDQLQHLTMN